MPLSVEVYETTTTSIVDPQHELADAIGKEFSTCYPGGTFATGSFFLPHDIMRNSEVQGVRRVVFRHGAKLVYEGWISNITSAYGSGYKVDTVGAAGLVAMNRSLRKRWADTRTTEDVWEYQTDASVYLGTDKCTVDRQNNRIRFVPKSESWTSGDFAAVRYTMPIGATVAQITYDYDFKEAAGANDWEIGLYRSSDASAWTLVDEAGGDTIAGAATTTAITTTSATSIDATLGTPVRYLEFRFYSRDNQTGKADGSYYGDFSNIVVKSETGNINMEEIAKDIITAVPIINSGTQYIQAAGTPLSLIPYVVDGWNTIADILNDITNKGDGTYARWAWYFLDSGQAFTKQSAPLLALAPYALTTDYEYIISMAEAPGLTISEDFDQIINDMVVSYNDPDGKQYYRTSADNAALGDSTSQALYKKRQPKTPFSLGLSTSTIADAYAQRLLAYYKDPLYHWSGPLMVAGYIRGKGDNPIHASEIRAGNRIRIEDYKGGHTWVITQTQYTDDGEICTITVGEPDLPLLPVYTPPAEGIAPFDPVTPSGGGGRHDSGNRTITDAQLEKWGLTRHQWWEIKATERGRALRASIKKNKKRG